MARDLPVESEWFRKPAFMEVSRIGDYRRYCWLAEPVAREGVYGVYYEIAGSLEARLNDDEKFEHLVTFLKDEGLKELHARITRGDKRDEGESFSSFLWVPAITFHEDGSLTIDGEAPYMRMTLVKTPLDLKNLYSRPGWYFCKRSGDSMKGFREDASIRGDDQVGPRG